MRDANSRFAGSTWRLAIAAVTTLLTCLGLGLSAVTASAEHVHGPVSFEFGQTGKGNSTFGGSVAGVGYDQARHRLFVLGHGVLFGFSNPAPGDLAPLPAPFPLSLYGGTFNFSEEDMAVDNSTGSTSGHIFYAPGYRITGWNAAGEPVPGFEGDQTLTKTGNYGIGVDGTGQLFTGMGQQQSIGIFGPGGGGQTGAISTSNSVGEIGNVAVDPTNNDVWVSSSYYSKIAHYTEASGYTSFTELPTELGGRASLAINGARHVIYVASGEVSSLNQINAYSTITGDLLDSFTVSGIPAALTVDESTDILFVSIRGERVQELRPILVPRAATGEPTGDATVSGTADPDGAGDITGCLFEFGPSTSYGSTQPCDQALPITAVTEVTATLPGLELETPYHYRLVLSNSSGQVKGVDQTITRHYVKGLRTDAASGLKRTEATLNGHYEGTSKETHFRFDWGLAGAPYEHSTTDDTKPAGTGNTPLATGITGLTANTTYHYRVVASNELGTSAAQDITFTTPPAVKDLSTDAPANITTTTASLRGTLDPDELPTTYYFQYGQSTAYGQTTPVPPGKDVGTVAAGDTQVETGVTDLEPGTTYHYRIIAVNSFGTTTATNDRSFSTAQGPSILSFTSRNVTANSAELVAKINSNAANTKYRFEYGTTLDYGAVAPSPVGTIDGGAGVEEVGVQLNGLQVSTYHFRVVAESDWGTTTTNDQTFNFFPPECPNAHLREQSGASYLPDCRAYELVSPLTAGNAALMPDAPLAPHATSPARFAFSGTFGGIAGVGEPQVNLTDLYVATRTPNGWATKYVGIPASVTSKSSGPPSENTESFAPTETIRVSADLSKFLVWDPGDVYGAYGKREGSYAPYIRTWEGTGLGRLPSNLADFPGAEQDVTQGGFIGATEMSSDFTHFVFSSRNVAFAEGGLSAAPGSVYSDDLSTGQVTLISKTPLGAPIAQDTGDATEYIRIPGLSGDGSHALMSTKGPGGATHLYMAVDDVHYYDVSEGADGENHAVRYVGMSEDGSTVYFTSGEQLTSDDHDSSVDLFVWREGASPAVTRVSVGGDGAGDTDQCPQLWTTGCNVAPISTGVRSDNAIAAQASDIYFYSPELLAGSRGIPGARNLYLFSGSQLRFVATLTGSNEVNRIQVSPEGDHMALITRARLSSAVSGGHKEMYSFARATGRFLCVSCKTNGGVPEYDVEGSQNGLFMSDDGRTFFSTIDSLVPQDTDGLRDSYEFVDSRAQLLSTGTADRADETGFVGVSSDGVDAYFSTLESLVPQDSVGPFLKFYDARTGGGFPFERVASPCAAADECHGPEPPAPAKLPATTGAALGAGGNVKSAAKRHKKKKKKKHRRSKSRGMAAGRHTHRETAKGDHRG